MIDVSGSQETAREKAGWVRRERGRNSSREGEAECEGIPAEIRALARSTNVKQYKARPGW